MVTPGQIFIFRTPGGIIVNFVCIIQYDKWLVVSNITGWLGNWLTMLTWIFVGQVVFSISLIFTPKIGEASHFDSYFSEGLQPPTRISMISQESMYACLFAYLLSSFIDVDTVSMGSTDLYPVIISFV